MESGDKSAICKALVQSMVGPLSSKIKLCLAHPLKNKKLAANLSSTIDVILEQVVPAHAAKIEGNFNEVNNLHNLVFLLAHKTQQVFTSRIIHTCMDQNWDLKGFKQVLVRIMKTTGVERYDSLVSDLDAQTKTQNLQSSSCIKAIGQFIRNPRKQVNENDLQNPISTYETDYQFLLDDISKYREQRIKHECFSVLHPWAYDLDQVDFKYIMNNDLTGTITQRLPSLNAQVFWFSFFKSHAAISADDLFGALRELATINLVPSIYEDNHALYQQHATSVDFVFSLE